MGQATKKTARVYGGASVAFGGRFENFGTSLQHDKLLPEFKYITRSRNKPKWLNVNILLPWIYFYHEHSRSEVMVIRKIYHFHGDFFATRNSAHHNYLTLIK